MKYKSTRAVSKIKRDWIAGASLADLGIEHDVSDAAIHHHVKGLVRDIPPIIGRLRTFDHGKALRLRRQGMPVAQVAKRMGVSRVRIYQIEKQAA